jgi:hypothetical protein
MESESTESESMKSQFSALEYMRLMNSDSYWET